MNERAIILDALLEIMEKGGYFHIVMGSVLDKYAYLPVVERHFIRRVTAGCVERCISLDAVIDLYSKTKTAKMKPVIRTLIRMGAYQLLYMDQVPDSAAVNESVKLAKKRGFSSLSGFVNGVLRTIAANKDTIPLPDKEKDRTGYLSVRYSMPEWIVRMADDLYGEQNCERVLASLLEKRKLSVRFSCLIDNEKIYELIKGFENNGVTVKRSPLLKGAYYLENVDDITALPGFDEGLFYIQDVGAMMVVEEAGIKAGDTVIDICAAPGGKSIHAAEKLLALEGEVHADRKSDGTKAAGVTDTEGIKLQISADGPGGKNAVHIPIDKKGIVIARDLTEYKTDIIRENVRRHNLSNVSVQTFDATVYDESLENTADVVIADLPCSGLGVISKKPDIKYRVAPEDILSLQKLQREILQNAASYVKAGGTLVYSTCTITREENEDNRDFILSELPLELISERRLTPGIDETDGFYILKLRKRE